MRGSTVCSLPEKIDRLHKLQTLDITGTPLTSVPASFWDIKTLRHVHTHWFKSINAPPKGSKLESILTLAYVDVMEWEKGLRHLRNVRKLGVIDHHNRGSRPAAQLLKDLEHLCNLIIGFRDLPEEIVDMRPFRSYKIIRYLTVAGNWPRSTPLNAAMLPMHLTQLVLYATNMEQDPMPELKKLTSIKLLHLIENATTCEKIVCPAGGFLQLERLWLLNTDSFDEWYIEKGSLPVLKYLCILNCGRLRSLPDLHHVTTLQELQLRYMSEEFISRSAHTDGEDWHKVKHIPSIKRNGNKPCEL